MSRRYQPPKHPVLLGIGLVFLMVMAYAVSTGLPPLMFGGDCASGQTGTGPQMAECTDAQNRGAMWLAIGTVAFFPGAFLSRSFTFLPGMAAMLLLTGFAALRELDEPGVRADISARHEQVVEIVSLCFLGAGVVLAACAVVALVRLARSAPASSPT
jgi:hypothetical protein